MASDKPLISQVDEEEHERSNEEKRSLLDQLICNLVPLSPKRPGASIKPELFGVENGEAIDFDNEENNNSVDAGGSNSNTDSIVDNIVSHLPPVLISDDAAPTTDEASILIHAVVHE